MKQQRWLRRGVLGLLLAVWMTLAALPASAQYTMATVLSPVNFRTGPSVSYPTQGLLPTGFQVLPIGRNADGSWIQVQIVGGQTGWVHSAYISAVTPLPNVPPTVPTGQNSASVNTGMLNLRNGPGANFEIVAKLPRGSVINLHGRNADQSWVQVSIPGGSQGWVSSRYILSNVPIYTLPESTWTGTNPGYPEPVPTGGQTGIVTYGPLNVRLGPGAWYGAFTWLNGGSGVSLIGRDAYGVWLLVQLVDGRTGWVHAGFISTTYPIANLPVRA